MGLPGAHNASEVLSAVPERGALSPGQESVQEDPGGGAAAAAGEGDSRWWWHPEHNVSLWAGLLEGGAFWPAGPGATCAQWALLRHALFQLGHALLLLAALAPGGNGGGRGGSGAVRGGAALGWGVLALWAWALDCSLDTLGWSVALLAANLLHLCFLLVRRLRPLRFSCREVEAAYRVLFRPLRVSRRRFRKVLACTRSLRLLQSRDIYAQEKLTRVDSLSLVLSGRLVVSQNGRPLHIVLPHQFLDSPEWFGVSTDEYFQVSITAMEESRVLVWHRDKLRLTIVSDQFLQAIFDHILGRDVVRKLVQVSETMVANNNGHLTNHVDEAAAEEDKPMLVAKQAEDGSGITSLLARQLQAADPDAWRLGKIEEADHETSV